MTLNVGKTYRFRYLDDVYSKADIHYFRLCLENESDSQEFMVRPLTSQLKHTPSYILYCKVISIEDNGFVRLIQDEVCFYKEMYQPYRTYSFVILEELEPTSTGIRRVLLECRETKLTHTYTCFDGMDLPVGGIVEYSVKLVNRDGHVAIHFALKEEELTTFSPENVFKAVGHADMKIKFFDNIEEWACTHNAIKSKITEMKGKLALNNRLWIFDYVRALVLLTILSEVASLDDVEKCCVLIKDIENWILNDSGLLEKFNEQNREETRKKIEQIINKSNNTLEAISVIRNNQQIQFVQELVEKSSRGISCDDNTLGIFIRLISLNREIIQDNIGVFSQLIEYTTSDFGDGDIAERIVYVLSSYINREKKLLNRELHYGRKKEVDKAVLSNLIIGIGTLLNFSISRQLGKDNELSLDQDKLFLVLCKYVSYICSKDKAVQLVNRSLLFLNGKGIVRGVDGNLLRNVAADPDALADSMISIQNEMKRPVSERFNNNLHLNFVNNALVIYKGNRLQGKDNIDSTTCVYTLPDSCIQLHDLSALNGWEDSEDLLYYRDKWKDYLESEVFHMEETETPDYVRIKVKPINTSKQNLIFCTRTDTDIKMDGVIHYSGYCPNYLCSDLTKIFRTNMVFKAKVDRLEDGKINFNITENIRNFSNKLAESQETDCVGLCLSVTGNRAFFITTNGITCACYLHNQYAVMEGDMFSLSVYAAINPRYFPVATPLHELPKTHNREALLTNQLQLLTRYNKSHFNDMDDYVSEQTETIPNVHLILDNLFHIYEDKVVRYNLYQIARLVCMVENKSLSTYYASCIQYMELMECFEKGLPVEYSFDEIHIHESQLEKFPSLQNQKHIHDLLCNFGAENDIESLYSMSTSKELPDRVNRFARISLAYALIESVTDDEDITNKIRSLAIAEIGNKTVDDVISTDNEINEDDSDEITVEDVNIHEKTNMVYDEAASEAASESEFDAEGIETQPEEQSDDILPENEDDSDSLMLCFYENGSYVISRDPETEGLVSQVSYNDKSTSMYIVQCYKNGHVNKIPVKNLFNLREEYEYRNGVYRETSLEKCFILDSKDYIIARFKVNQKEYYRFANVSSVSVHSSLGLRGTPVACYSDVQDLAWFYLKFESVSPSLADMIRDASSGLGVEKENPKYQEGILWIRQNVCNEEVGEPNSSSENNEIVNLLINKEYDRVRDFFSQFIKPSSKTPQIQNLAKESISLIKDNENLWRLVSILIECSVNIYRKPIVDAFDGNSSLHVFKPEVSVLDNIVQTVFSFDNKYNQSLALVYHYRDCLSEKSKDFIYKQCSKLTTPLDYERFSEIVGLDFDETIEVLLSDAVPASYFRLYEVLSSYLKENGRTAARQLARKILSELSDKKTSAKLFKQLISYAICDEPIGNDSIISIKRIISEGFNEYNKYCSRRQSQVNIQRTASNINSYIGKKDSYVVIGVYKNHYLLTSRDGLLTLLPKNCSIGKHSSGNAVNVTIIDVDSSHRTLFVSEISKVDKKAIRTLPLVDINDVIEVKFTIHNGLTPVPSKCFSRLHVRIVEYPSEFNYKLKYQARVVRCIDYFTFEIKLLRPII